MHKRHKSQKSANSVRLDGYGGVVALIGEFTRFGDAARFRFVCKAARHGVRKTWTNERIKAHCEKTVKEAHVRAVDLINAIKLPGLNDPGKSFHALGECRKSVCFCDSFAHAFLLGCTVCTRVAVFCLYTTGNLFPRVFGATELALRMVECFVYRESLLRWDVVHGRALQAYPNGPCGGLGPYWDSCEAADNGLLGLGYEVKKGVWDYEEMKQWMLGDGAPEKPAPDPIFEEEIVDLRVWRKGEFTRTALLSRSRNYKKLSDATFLDTSNTWLYAFRAHK
jgi:hypothetical protein